MEVTIRQKTWWGGSLVEMHIKTSAFILVHRLCPRDLAYEGFAGQPTNSRLLTRTRSDCRALAHAVARR
jgi:hypothetical protein